MARTTTGKTGATGKTGKTGRAGPKWAAEDVAILHTKIDGVVKSVDHLTQVIFEGNGEQSMMVRVAKAEELIIAQAANSKANADAVATLACTVTELVQGMKLAKEEIETHPSISRWISKSPWKAMTTIGSLIMGTVVFLIGLHALLSVPAVALWFEHLFGLP